MVFDQLPTLVRVLGQHLAGPADQPGGGLVACAGDHADVQQQLITGEPPGGARLILELDIEQLGHDVIRWMLGPPVDVLSERLTAVYPFGRHRNRLAGFGAYHRVGAVPDGLLVLFGYAQSMPITRIGI